jgi:glycosyltransferase involved in cell wall biosynthesis
MERTHQISRSLARAGHRCTILTSDGGLSPDYAQHYERLGLRLFALPSFWKPFYLPKPSQRLIKKLVAEADVVHLMGHWTLINAMVFRAVRKLAKPYVVCPAGCLPIFGRYKILKRLYNFFIGREIIFHAYGCIAISTDEIDQFKLLYDVQPSQVTVIPNGISPDDFPESDGKKFRMRYDIGNAPLILFMGRLNLIKGPDMFLDAFCLCSQDEQLKAYHLAFVGPDEGMLRGLKHVVEAAGMNDRVHFTGYIGGDEKADAYRAADFLVIPSRQEAMSIVVLEAGITGTPVLITDRCGFDDVAAVAGGMVVEASVDGLREGLLAMAGNPAKLKIMGKNLEKLTREHFLWDQMANRHLELFTRIMY